jgi:Aspartokinases
VDGVFTADPRKVPTAFPLTAITYAEAGELAHFGAKVIHPKTMYPAQQKGIPIIIKNTFNPTAPGTIISDQQVANSWPITGVTALTDVSLLNLSITQTGDSHQTELVLGQLLSLLNQASIEVILVSQASYENSFSLAIVPSFCPKPLK